MAAMETCDAVCAGNPHAAVTTDAAAASVKACSAHAANPDATAAAQDSATGSAPAPAPAPAPNAAHAANAVASDEAVCRICYAREPAADLVVPCGCKGSHRFCHLECLRSWQATVQASNCPARAAVCSICKEPYRFAPLAEPLHKMAWRQVATPLNAVLQGCMTPFQFVSCVMIVAVVSFLAGFLSTSLLEQAGGVAKQGVMLDLYSSWHSVTSSIVILLAFFGLMTLSLWFLVIPGFQAASISAAVTLAVAAAATSHTAAYGALTVVALGSALSEADCLDLVTEQGLRLLKLMVPPSIVRLPKFMRVADGA